MVSLKLDQFFSRESFFTSDLKEKFPFLLYFFQLFPNLSRKKLGTIQPKYKYQHKTN